MEAKIITSTEVKNISFVNLFGTYKPTPLPLPPTARPTTLLV
jgi:hypothetical protein